MPADRQRIEDMNLTSSGTAGSGPAAHDRPSGSEREGAPETREPDRAAGHAEPPESRYAGPPRRSGKAVAALSCAIVGFFIAGIVLGLIAVVLGVLARREIAARPELTGSGMALAGIIIGGLSFVLAIVVLALGGPSIVG